MATFGAEVPVGREGAPVGGEADSAEVVPTVNGDRVLEGLQADGASDLFLQAFRDLHRRGGCWGWPTGEAEKYITINGHIDRLFLTNLYGTLHHKNNHQTFLPW